MAGCAVAVGYSHLEVYHWVGMMSAVQNQNNPLENCPPMNIHNCCPVASVSAIPI